jgi:hypothetical protein
MAPATHLGCDRPGRDVGLQQRKYKGSLKVAPRIDFVVAWRGRGRRESGHRATLVPRPVSSHTDVVRPQILR